MHRNYSEEKKYFQEKYQKHLNWLNKIDDGERLHICLEDVDSDFSHYDFSHSTLRGSSFYRTNFSFAKLKNVCLDDAFFYNVNASYTDFSETNLSTFRHFIDVNFEKANVYKTSFPGYIIPVLFDVDCKVQYFDYAFHYGIKVPIDNSYESVYTIQSAKDIDSNGTSCLSSLEQIVDEKLSKFLLKNVDAIATFNDYETFFYLNPNKISEDEVLNFLNFYKSSG